MGSEVVPEVEPGQGRAGSLVGQLERFLEENEKSHAEEKGKHDRADGQLRAELAVAPGEQRDDGRRQQRQQEDDPGEILGLEVVSIHRRRVLELHRGEVFDVGGLALAVKGDDEREAHGHFRRRDGDDEEDHDLAVEDVVEPAEGDKGEVGGVEHQLEGHVHDEQVAPQDDAQHAEAEERGADDEVMFESDVHTGSTTNGHEWTRRRIGFV